MGGPFHPLVERVKSIAAPVTWSAPDPKDGRLQFLVPLDIDGVTVAELALRGVAYETRQDADVMLQLETGIAGVRTRVPLARLDWLPLSPIHRNPFRGPPEMQGRLISGSHAHLFEHNWLEAEQRMMRGNLPVAEAMPANCNTFAGMVAYAERVLRIGGLDGLPEPPWAPRLL
jgi:hypothetical protein